jgi:hypothetical protein
MSSLFSAIIRTAVNVALLPVAVAKDVLTMGDDLPFGGDTATQKQLAKLKREAEKADED